MKSNMERKKKIIFEPTLVQRLLAGYYFMSADCSNCEDPTGSGAGLDIDVMIPLKMKKPTKAYKCPNCKCLTLKII